MQADQGRNFMLRLTLAAMALTASLAMSLTPAQARAGNVSRTPDPSPDDPLREAKLADRERTADLNAAQARYVAERDRGRTSARRARSGGSQARYRAEQERYRNAQAQYQADMAAWRRQVAACRNGDWSACDR